MIELVLDESARIVRRRGAFLICETRHGFVCAAAGVDRSNAGGGDAPCCCRSTPTPRRAACAPRCRRRPRLGVVVTDSFGRPFRLGTTGVAIGCAGLAPLHVHTGEPDDAGRVLQHTAIHLADQLAPPRSSRRAVRRRARRGRARPRLGALRGGRGAGLMPAERDLFRGVGRGIESGHDA